MSKRYDSAYKQVALGKPLPLKEALELVLSLPKTKFDETVELALRMAVDSKQKQAGVAVRGVVQLPHGNGKAVRIIAFTHNPEEAKEAKKAGAKEVGLADLIEKIQNGWLDFDVAVATPEAMKEVKVLARILGPKGLMPSPKAGTIVDSKELLTCIQELQKGRVEFKADKDANIQLGVGKRSFGVEFKADKDANIQLGVGKRSFGVDKLQANIESVLEAVERARPEGVREKFILRGFVSSTMGPSVPVSHPSFA